MLEGQAHWPAEFLKAPSGHGLATAGGSAGAGGAGGATAGCLSDVAGAGSEGGTCVGLTTHWPSRKSCQGKHRSASAVLDCEYAGDEMEKVRQIKIAVAAEKRVMQKPRRHPNLGHTRSAC
jgi:hypothetical protein